MFRIILGVFIIWHGIVHLIFAGHSAGLFEMQPEMTWPDDSWAFSTLFGNDLTRKIAVALLAVIAIGLFASGGGLLFKQAWWQPIFIKTAIFSSIFYLIMWDATFQQLDNQGFVGILINLAFVISLHFFNWPRFDL